MPYTNLDGTTPDNKLGDLLRWRLGRRRRASDKSFVPPIRANDGSALTSLAPHLTWVGHATFVQRLGKKLIATDPLWSGRVGPIARRVPPGVALENVPPLDIVTISHSHYDHLDLPSLRRIGPAALYVVPRDVGPILRSAGLSNVIELGWWESHTVDDVRITLVPSQHWSMRVPWDRNKRLWGGFVYESSEGTSYHAGDTAFSESVFQAIAERFGRIDWAMLPIGAYDPPWFMQPQHMNPEEAARTWEILRARILVAMHWGTFKLTDEPMDEPPIRLREIWTKSGYAAERLWVLDIGETRRLVRSE